MRIEREQWMSEVAECMSCGTAYECERVIGIAVKNVECPKCGEPAMETVEEDTYPAARYRVVH